jgi:hypothetical protein
MELVDKILVENGLDFNISKLPLVGLNGNSNVMTPYYGLFNDKTGEIIHTCKKGYHPSQNREVVELVLEGMKPFGDDLKVTKGGALNGGRRIFLQLAIQGDAKVGDDTIKRYVTIIDSNDGSTGLSVGVGDLTMSCQNQFFFFYKTGQNKFRHTVSLEEKIKGLPTAIEEALGESMLLVKRYHELASTPLTRGLVDKLVNHLVGTDRTASMDEITDLSTKKFNAMETLYTNIETELEQKGNNLWGLHSGVTRWTTHEKSAPRRENGRLESIMTSTNYKTNQASLKFALAHV